MDLVSSSSRVVVIMEHTLKGNPKILKKCTLPLTGLKCVDRIITDMAVFDIVNEKLVLVEHAEEVSVDEIKNATEANFSISSNLTRF